jgi:hypothetical protein
LNHAVGKKLTVAIGALGVLAQLTVAGFTTSASADPLVGACSGPAPTTLTGAIIATDTTINVASSAGFPNPGATSPAIGFPVQIDSEQILVTAVSGTAWTVVRGNNGTPTASHAGGAAVSWFATLINGPAGCTGVQTLLRNSGSDASVQVSQSLGDLYTGSPGCIVDQTKVPTGRLSVTSDYKGCNATQAAGAPGTSQLENFDHDTIATDYPTGANAGLFEICHQGVGHTQEDFARQSRDPIIAGAGADCNGLTYNGFALDGVPPILWRNVPASSTQGAPSNGCLVGQAAGSCTGTPVTDFTLSQLTDIYLKCTTPDPGPGHVAGTRLVDWRQLTVSGFTLPNPYSPYAADAEPINLYTAPPNAGTRTAWEQLVLGSNDSSACLGDANKNPSAGGTDLLGNVTFQNNAANFVGNTQFIPWCPKTADATYSCTAPGQPAITVPGETFYPFTTLPQTSGILSQSLWYFTFARYQVAKQDRQQGTVTSLNGISVAPSTLLNNSFPTTRAIWYVTPTTNKYNPVGVAALPGGSVNCSSGVSADCSLQANLQPGTQTFINWLCGSSNSGVNPFDGNTYFFDITSSISKNGFTRVPASSTYNDPSLAGRTNAGTSCIYEYTGLNGP